MFAVAGLLRALTAMPIAFVWVRQTKVVQFEFTIIESTRVSCSFLRCGLSGA